jgi:hypothetical protein
MLLLLFYRKNHLSKTYLFLKNCYRTSFEDPALNDNNVAHVSYIFSDTGAVM